MDGERIEGIVPEIQIVYRNEQGETVANGVYFYTLTVGDFSATRKILIQTISREALEE